jgi:RHS repeat-associated protein
MNTLTDSQNSVALISGMTYGVANEVLGLTSANAAVNGETRQYNSLFQMTRLTVGSVLDKQYAFPAAGTNNGKIVSETDVLSGEQVLYTYDSLNRLATAQTAGAGGWGQSYNFDGFGNLTDQNVIKGSAPSMHVTYSAATNRQSGDVADANGNILGSATPSLQNVFDIENRITNPGGTAMKYGYDAGNKRIWRGDGTFWAGSQRMASYNVTLDTSYFPLRFQVKETSVYFGGKLVSKGAYASSCTCADKIALTAVAADRLGNMNGKFYPFGQERPSATSNDKEKFTGYYRDAVTGSSGTLFDIRRDYADQRYHQSGVGRFMTPDPSSGSVSAADPGSWNRYAYVGGDPVNRVDPTKRKPGGVDVTTTVLDLRKSVR